MPRHSKDIPAGDAATVFIGWQVTNTIAYISAPGSATQNAPVEIRTIRTTTYASGVLVGGWSRPIVATPRLVQTASAGEAAPDGHASLIPATRDPLTDVGAWGVVDAVSGQATLVGDAISATWTSNEALALVEFDPQSNLPVFVLYDVATGKSRSVGSMPPEYETGVWLGR